MPLVKKMDDEERTQRRPFWTWCQIFIHYTHTHTHTCIPRNVPLSQRWTTHTFYMLVFIFVHCNLIHKRFHHKLNSVVLYGYFITDMYKMNIVGIYTTIIPKWLSKLISVIHIIFVSMKISIR